MTAPIPTDLDQAVINADLQTQVTDLQSRVATLGGKVL